jgi:hypothetical protein
VKHYQVSFAANCIWRAELTCVCHLPQLMSYDAILGCADDGDGLPFEPDRGAAASGRRMHNGADI